MANKNKNAFYIEPNNNGGYNITKGGGKRASDTADTQGKAIERAKDLNPDAPIHVARVRETDKGHPDQYRKA